MNCSIYDLVPKHKSDISHLQEIKELSDDEIRPILFSLLEWIRDINWPIASEILAVLEKHQKEVIPLISKVLVPEESDNIWKYWIIKELLPLFSYNNLKPIIPNVRRIAINPTKSEVIEEVNCVANDFLSAWVKR